MTGLATHYLPASAQAPKSQATKSCNLRAIGVCVSLRLGASRCMSKCRSAELRRTLVLVGQVPGSDYSSSSAMLFTNGEVDPKVRLLAQQNAIQLFDRELLGRAIDEVAPMPYSGVPLLGEQIRLGASSIARRARAAFNGPPVANKSDIDRHRPDRSGPSETE